MSAMIMVQLHMHVIFVQQRSAIGH